MGWTFFPGMGKSRLEHCVETIQYENERLAQRVIDSAVVGSVVYMLVEQRYKIDLPPEHFEKNTYIPDPDGTVRAIAVFLTKSNKRASDGYDFGYKDMDESMGPVEKSCPKRIIDKASPLRDPTGWAGQWRAACLERIEKRKGKVKLQPGMKIKLEHSVRFTDGYEEDTFTVDSYQRRGKNRTCFIGQNGGRYRISNMSDRQYSVI
jgi:hypothetical protein